MASQRNNSFLSKHLPTIILVGVFLVGVGLIAYPTFSDWWNSFHQTRAIASYASVVENLDKQDYDAMLDDAHAYNKTLGKGVPNFMLSDDELRTYSSLLDITGTGIMGYIDIPKIRCQLPIYHGTDEAVLQIAVGHVPGTSLPVGGEGTHCVVSSHRGLPSARLFTDIDQLVEGDVFVLRTLNETLTYEVDKISIVLPNELDALAIEPGKDYCTLVTCTPYGVNTHRLLVRGHRVPNAANLVVTPDAIQIEAIAVAPFVAVPMLLVLLVWLLTSTASPRDEVTGRKRMGLGERLYEQAADQLREREGARAAAESGEAAPATDEGADDKG